MSFESFLTKENFEGYEDPERYKKEWVPRLDKYRADLDPLVPSVSALGSGSVAVWFCMHSSTLAIFSPLRPVRNGLRFR